MHRLVTQRPSVLTSLARKFSSKKIEQYFKIYRNFYGIDLTRASKTNTAKVLSLLYEGNKTFAAHVTKPEDVAYFEQLPISNGLSEDETALFHKLQDSFSLKHATYAVEEILSNGKMLSIRELEAQGKSVGRHTWTQNADDRSVYFTMGIGQHKTPSFLAGASHVISMNLAQISRQDIDTLNRIWVGGHGGEYDEETNIASFLGDVRVHIQHYKDRTKIYTFHYHSGQTLVRKIKFEDEVFVGQDILPGIALQFIYLLRLLGGKHNKLVQKLYQSLDNPEQFEQRLEKIFSKLMPGWVYPEAKIIGEVDINKDYVSIQTMQAPYQNPMEDAHSKILKHCIEKKDYYGLLAFLKKGYLPYEYAYRLYAQVFNCIHKPEDRIKFLKLFVRYGFNHTQPRCARGDESAIQLAIQKHDVQSLDFLLSTVCLDPSERLVGTLADPNMRFENKGSDGVDYCNLADFACGEDFTGQIITLLKQHGVDFKKNGYEYLKSALGANGKNVEGKRVNYWAVKFLHQEGVTANSDTPLNETPLMLACLSRDLNLVNFLIDKMQAKVNTPFQANYERCYLGKVANGHSSNGLTALHYAAQTGKKNLVQLLLAKGANPRLQTVDGRLPSAMTDNVEIQALLNVQGLEVSTPSAVNMPYHMVTGMLTGLDEHGQRYVVLGRRHPHNPGDPEANYYSFPGGAADITDLTLEDAVKREVFEETSVDVNRIPTTKIRHLATIHGFRSARHQATSFYLIDVGYHPIEVLASDDLIEAIKVPVDQLQIQSDQPTALFMRHEQVRILGSNAFLINQFLLSNQKKLSDAEYTSLKNQLYIEADGYDLLIDLIVNNQSEMIPGTSAWAQVESVLANQGFRAQKTKETSLSLAMLQANPFAGIELLTKHGINLSAWKEQGKYSIRGENEKGSPISFAVDSDNLPLLKHLMSLGASLTDPPNEDQLLLQRAAGLNNMEILDFLLDQGLNPNKSWEFKGSDFIIFPITGMAIKNGIGVKHIIDDGRIYLNRERSPMTRSSTLMTAIEYNNVRAAFYLLASGRINLQAKDKESKTAADHAIIKSNTAVVPDLKKKWGNVSAVINFLNLYSDMNDWLKKNALPVMQNFIYSPYTTTGNGIYFISDSILKLRKIAKRFSLPVEIHQDESGCSMHLKSVHLQELFGGALAEYLLNFAEKSPFMTVRHQSFRNLQADMVNNESKFVASTLKLTTHFKTITNPAYYRQIIRENPLLDLVVLTLDNSDWSGFVLEAIKGHDKITTLDLTCGEHVSQAQLASAFECLTSLPELNSINLSHFSFANLYDLFVQLIQKQCINNLTLTINDEYSKNDYLQLALLIKNSGWCNPVIFKKNTTIIHHLEIDNVVKYNQEALVKVETPDFSSRILTTSLQEDALQATAQTKRNTKRYMSVTSNTLDTDGIDTLIKSLKIQPIEFLNLECTDFVVSTDKLTELAETIAYSKTMRAVLLDKCRFNGKTVPQEFVSALSHSQTLLCVSLPRVSYSAEVINNLDATCDRNVTAHLTAKQPKLLTGRGFTRQTSQTKAETHNRLKHEAKNVA